MCYYAYIEQGADDVNNKKMKAKLKKIDDLASKVAELSKEFDMGNLSERIEADRLAVVEKIGKKGK